MYIQITPRARVYVTSEEIKFINKYKNKDSFRSTDLLPEEINTAKILADKSVLVRKKLGEGVQYALNRYIKFVDDDSQK
jgi:hypothetical protein